MSSNSFSETIAALSDLGPLRVWSLIVTIFGDLAQSSDATIEGTTLSAILTEIGIKPEATRVALHRLRNEGWITSNRSGRNSRHSLTPVSREESAAASRRIYPTTAPANGDWVLAVLPENNASTQADMRQRGFIQLMPRVFIGSTWSSRPTDASIHQGGDVPAWLAEQLDQPEINQGYDVLCDALRQASADLPTVDELSPLQIAVLRCMIVHCWRRIVLKHPDLPRQLFPKDWRGHECRELVAELLRAYPRPSLSEIA